MDTEWTKGHLAPQVGFEPTTLRLTAESRCEAARMPVNRGQEINGLGSLTRPEFASLDRKKGTKEGTIVLSMTRLTRSLLAQVCGASQTDSSPTIHRLHPRDPACISKLTPLPGLR